MSDLKGRLREDLNAARRERDKARTSLLTMTISELKNREIELGREASDEDVLDVITKAVKRRKEAAVQIRAAGRAEMADREDAEAVVLGVYLPEQLSEADVRAFARDAIEAGANNVGALMSQLMPRLKGRFDGKEASRIAREELG
ncbi:MAG: GatB/YqeY domain-containing protein [Longimicrobiales bacterium]